MWLVDARELCAAHLLGEHVEMHMFAGCLRLGKNIDGYLAKGLVELHRLEARHAELVEEMERRGYRHRSPLPPVSCDPAGSVDSEENRRELARRCPMCAERQREVS